MLYALTTIVFGAVLLAAVALDLRFRRLPNVLTAGALLLALVLRAPLGADELTTGLVGAAVGLVFGIPFFVGGMLGGGDVKLLAAVGAFLGFPGILTALLLTLLLGGVFALAQAFRRGALKKLVQGTALLAVYITSMGIRGHRTGVAEAESDTLPYALPIALGATMGWFL